MEEIRIENPALSRMRRGGIALGLVVRLARSGEIARIARTSGHDFLFIDTQHALFSLETIGHIAQVANGCGVATIVRVPRYDDPDIPKLLDGGATGIVVADVTMPEQARRAVETCRFPPRGKRSVQSTYSLTDYRRHPVGELIAHIDRETLVACMVESAAGLESLETIAAVDGVDLIHLGCTDLLADMGKPDAFGDPAMLSAVDRLIAACRKHGKFAGLGGDRDLGRLTDYFAKGLNFYTTQTDIAYLLEGASQRASAIRDAAERRD